MSYPCSRVDLPVKIPTPIAKMAGKKLRLILEELGVDGEICSWQLEVAEVMREIGYQLAD